MPKHCSKSQSRKGSSKKSGRSLGSRRRRHRQHRRPFGSGENSTYLPHAIRDLRNALQTPSLDITPQVNQSAKESLQNSTAAIQELQSQNLPGAQIYAEQAAASAQDAKENVHTPDDTVIAQKSGQAAKEVKGKVEQAAGGTKSWYDQVTGLFRPTDTFNSMAQIVTSKIPTLTIPTLPAGVSDAKDKLVQALIELFNKYPFVTEHLPWFAVGTAVVCLGLRAAWPQIRAAYLKAEKTAQRYSTKFVNSLNSDDDFDASPRSQQRKSSSSRNKKSSGHRYGKSKRSVY